MYLFLLLVVVAIVVGLMVTIISILLLLWQEREKKVHKHRSFSCLCFHSVYRPPPPPLQVFTRCRRTEMADDRCLCLTHSIMDRSGKYGQQQQHLEAPQHPWLPTAGRRWQPRRPASNTSLPHVGGECTGSQGPHRAACSHERQLLRGTGQTTVNKRTPICYIIPINDMVHRPL